MAKRIAVQDGLSNVRQALQAKGFEVTNVPDRMGQGTLTRVDAVVLTGLSTNAMGFHDTDGVKVPVIDAEGMTANEIVERVSERLHAIETAERGV